MLQVAMRGMVNTHCKGLMTLVKNSQHFYKCPKSTPLKTQGEVSQASRARFHEGGPLVYSHPSPLIFDQVLDFDRLSFIFRENLVSIIHSSLRFIPQPWST
jgi:hypothetical protein